MKAFVTTLGFLSMAFCSHAQLDIYSGRARRGGAARGPGRGDRRHFARRVCARDSRRYRQVGQGGQGLGRKGGLIGRML